MFYTQSTAKGLIRAKHSVFLPQVQILINYLIRIPPLRIREIWYAEDLSTLFSYSQLQLWALVLLFPNTFVQKVNLTKSSLCGQYITFIYYSICHHLKICFTDAVELSRLWPVHSTDYTSSSSSAFDEVASNGKSRQCHEVGCQLTPQLGLEWY